MRKTITTGMKFWFGQSWPLFLLATVPLATDYLKNHYQIPLQDLGVPLILNLITALIISLVFWRLAKRHLLAAQIGAILTVLVVTNNYESRLSAIYPVIKAFFPFSLASDNESIIFSLIFFLLLIVIDYWLGRLTERFIIRFKWSTKDISGAIKVAIGITFILVFLPSAQLIIRAWPQFFYKPPKINASLSATSKPDIYYIVLDRYASAEVLKKQFNFDNSDFANYLKTSGYYVNPNSHNNYPYTTMSIASTLNADYLTDIITKFNSTSAQTLAPYHNSIKNSAVISALRSIGYRYNLIGNWYDTSNRSPLADVTYQNDGRLTIFGQTTTLGTFAKNEFSTSLYWRLLHPGLTIGKYHLATYSSDEGSSQIQFQLDKLSQLAGQPAGGRFIFGHILVPHDPYYFNADGSTSTTPDSNNAGAPIKQKYLGQVQFINSKIKQLITKINQTSNGSSIVVLQSDEGPYPIQLNHNNFEQDSIDSEVNNQDMRTWDDDDLAMKYGNLAAYHIPAASNEQLKTSADSVNIFRLILNNYFGANFSTLPKCYYAYPNGRAKPFSYVNINDRLTGTLPDPTCPKT